MVEIRMTVAGEDLTFRSCGRCEAKHWLNAEGPLPLARVLDLARPAR